MNMPRDNESLKSKMMRMSNAHNTFVAETRENNAQLQIMLNNLMYVLEKEVEDFEEKYKRADFVTHLESTIQGRLNAHLTGDLNGYKTFGEQLAIIRKKAKEEGLQSLYNKVTRRQRRKMEEADFGTESPAVDPKKITHTPAIQLVENLNDQKRLAEAEKIVKQDDGSSDDSVR